MRFVDAFPVGLRTCIHRVSVRACCERLRCTVLIKKTHTRALDRAERRNTELVELLPGPV
jgi:hypothetical protein